MQFERFTGSLGKGQKEGQKGGKGGSRGFGGEVPPPPGGKGRKKREKEAKQKQQELGGKKFKCPAKTPEGELVCFRYNTTAGCKAKPCRFVHCCGICFAKGDQAHPWFRHPKDTAG